MHFVYIDDSGDEKIRAFSALAIPDIEWKKALGTIKEYRRALKNLYGIFVTKELHATDFVAGRGRISTKVVPKGLRCQLFRETLMLVSGLPGVRLINAISPKEHERLIFERLMNRINTNMRKSGSNAVIVHDEGKDYTYLVRRLGVYNPIQSMYGKWPGGNTHKNIPLDNVLEDIVFRNSEDSYFIQLADFCAFALFRSEHILKAREKYDLHNAFDELKPICVREAFGGCPRGLGIIRHT